MNAALVSPPRSKVTAEQLSEEVAEYFTLGVRVAPGDTVLDVGANVGAFALHVAKQKVEQVVLETHDRDGRLAQIEALLHDNGLGAICEAPQKTGDNGRQAILVYARRKPEANVARDPLYRATTPKGAGTIGRLEVVG